MGDQVLSNELLLFVSAIRHSPEMRRLLSEVRTPGEIVAIGNQCGYSFTIKDLKLASSDLAADHWAWGGKSSAWRQAFFAEQQSTQQAASRIAR